jgi:hypothetical protein
MIEPAAVEASVEDEHVVLTILVGRESGRAQKNKGGD